MNSIVKLDDGCALDNDQFITYTTNLMELILSTSSSDKSTESLLTTLNLILTSSTKMIKTLSSVHVSLAVKSNIQHSNNTLVHLIERSDKLAKAFRKLFLKETNVIGNLEKLLLAALASINNKADVTSKFIKGVKKVFEEEIDKYLKTNNCNLPSHAIVNLQKLVYMLKTNYNVDFDHVDFKAYRAENILQIKLIDILYGDSDKDDEIKSLLLMPSLKLATAELRKSPSEDDMAFETLCDVINQRMEQLHSLSSFYTNPQHNEVWTKFVKGVLKQSLKLVVSDNKEKTGKRGTQALNTLISLCRKLYGISNTKKKKTRGWKENADEDCQRILNMICGHSNFLSLLYTKNKSRDWQTLKFDILNLIIVLIESNPKICEDLELPVFLGAYHATLSASDNAILQIVHRCEVETSGEGKVSKLAMLQPLLWGQAAVSKYSTLHNKRTKVTQTSEILQLIEPERMLRSAVNFPLPLKMDISQNYPIEHDSNYYDPRFFLPLVCHLCAPGAYIDRHLKLIESGVLALVFASFSSYDSIMRALGCTALCRIYNQIASAKKALSAEKQIWLHLIEVVKNGISQQIDDADGIPKRVPSIVIAFLAKSTTILSSPLDPMYKPISSFFLAKPALDMFSVPNFLRLFHSQNIRQCQENDEELNEGVSKPIPFSNNQHIIERNWILSVIRDGMRDTLDFSILQQNFVFKILLTFFSSKNKNLCDNASKHIILNILKLAVGIKSKVLDLIKRQGFLIWVLDQANTIAEEICSKNNVDEAEKLYEGLVETIIHSWSCARSVFNNTHAVTDEKLTLMEFHHTTKDVLLLTLNVYKKRSLSLKFFRSLVIILIEVGKIRTTNKSNSSSDMNHQVSTSSKEEVKEMCTRALLGHENDSTQIDNKKNAEEVQQEIEEIFKCVTT